MVLTDTHTHLYDKGLQGPLSNLIGRAEKNHVSRFFIPNVDQHTCESVLSVHEQFPTQCFPMLGLHPVHVKEDYAQELDAIETFFLNRPVVAVGEIGLDYYWDRTFAEAQKKAFIRQCEWASSLHLPISIHCRNAFPELIGLLKENRQLSLRGVFHCFTGSLDEASQILDLGFYLGIGGVLTYKNSQLPATLGALGLDHILLETDAPYLPPVPYRGKVNESAYLIHTAEFLGQLKKVSLEEIADITTANSKQLFGV